MLLYYLIPVQSVDHTHTCEMIIPNRQPATNMVTHSMRRQSSAIRKRHDLHTRLTQQREHAVELMPNKKIRNVGQKKMIVYWSSR